MLKPTSSPIRLEMPTILFLMNLTIYSLLLGMTVQEWVLPIMSIILQLMHSFVLLLSVTYLLVTRFLLPHYLSIRSNLQWLMLAMRLLIISLWCIVFSLTRKYFSRIPTPTLWNGSYILLSSMDNSTPPVQMIHCRNSKKMDLATMWMCNSLISVP